MKFSNYNLIIFDDQKKQNILFNTLYGECFKADENIIESIEKDDINILGEEMRNIFKDKSIIIDDEVDENYYIEYFHNKAKFNTDTLSFTILLTWACNLRCVYCYEGAGEIRNKSLNSEECQSIITYIKKQIDSTRPRNVSIMLFGGEPLMNMTAADIILSQVDQYCTENNIRLYTSIITNGVLFDEDKIKFLKRYRCRYVQITLDGVKEIHDKRRISKDGNSSFDKVISTLKMLNQRTDFIKPLIRINVDKNNIGSTEVLLQYLKDEGLNTCGIDFGIVRSGTEACAGYASSCFIEAELGKVLEKLWGLAHNAGFKIKPRPMRKFLYCGLNKENSYTIAPTLDVYKCWEQVGEEKHKVGHINKDGSFNENTYRIIDWMSINPNMVKECKECVYLPACGGGCAAQAYNQAQTYHNKGCFRVKGVLEKELIYNLREKGVI